MSDNDELTTDEGDEETAPKDNIRDLRAKAKKADANEAENKALKRQLAFLEAGIPSEGKVAAMFRDTYNDELDPNTVKAKWTELSQELGAPKDVEDKAPADEVADIATHHRNMSGNTPVDPSSEPVPDWRKSAWEANRERRGKGESQREASAEVFTRLIDQAVKGNPDALVQPVDAEELARAKATLK